MSTPRQLISIARLLLSLASATGMVRADAAGTSPAKAPAPSHAQGGHTPDVHTPDAYSPGHPVVEWRAQQYSAGRKEALREFGSGSFDKLHLTNEEAVKVVDSLTDPESHQLIEDAWRHISGPVWQFLQEHPGEWPPKWELLSAESRKWPLKTMAAFRAEYRAWLGRYLEAHAARIVRRLDGISKWQLDDFIRRTSPAAVVNFDSEVAHVERWIQEREKKLREARTQIDDSFMRKTGTSTVDALFRRVDEHEANYWSAAHRAFIKRFPTLERLRAEGWNLDATTERDLGHILGHLGRRLPGGQPSLVYLLDPGAVADAAQAAVMTAAFAAEGTERQPPEFLHHDDIDRFIAGYAGGTLVVVGHIDGETFVASRKEQPPLVLDIVKMMRAAEAHRVLLVPVGCDSSRTKATFGFLREIGTAEVAKFLGALPKSEHTIGDLFAALAQIAPIEVKGRQLADHLEAVLRPTTKMSDELVQTRDGGPAEAITIVRVPRTALAPVHPSPSLYQAAIAADIERIRPWHDSGPLQSWRALYRAHPIWSLLASTVVVAIIGWGAYALRKRLERPTRPAMRGLRAVTSGLFGLAGLLLVGAILRLAIEYWGWTIALALLVFMIALSEKSPHPRPTQEA